MKFNTTKTKGGYKILSLHGPDECDEYAGIVDTGGSYLTITWYDTGVPVSANELYSLIPLDEPKSDHKIEAWLETLEERLDNLVAHHKHTESFAADIWQRLNHIEEGLSKRVEALEKDTDGTINNLFDRVNRVEYDNKESNTWGVRVNGDLQELHNRILKLERKTADTSDYHNLRLQIQDVEKQLEALEQDVKNSEEWGEHVNSDLSQLVLQVRALEQRTKTDEKGVWVTRKTLIDAYLKTSNINDLAKRLGLEE